MDNELKSYVEKEAEKAESLQFCRGIKLLHIRESIKEILCQIGRMSIFEEYTKHDISHIDEMLGIIEWLIPDGTKKVMTSAEWLMLTLAVYFHDLGMVVTKEEYNNRDKSPFLEYKSKILREKEKLEYVEFVEQDNSDTFLYQEFVRENHARRVKQWINEELDDEFADNTIMEIIQEILKPLDPMFKADLAMICESHHKNDM